MNLTALRSYSRISFSTLFLFGVFRQTLVLSTVVSYSPTVRWHHKSELNNNHMSSLITEDHHDSTIKYNIDAVAATVDANELHVNEDATVFFISLDDGVEVLKVEDNDKADELYGQKHKHVGSLLGK